MFFLSLSEIYAFALFFSVEQLDAILKHDKNIFKKNYRRNVQQHKHFSLMSFFEIYLSLEKKRVPSFDYLLLRKKSKHQNYEAFFLYYF